MHTPDRFRASGGRGAYLNQGEGSRIIPSSARQSLRPGGVFPTLNVGDTLVLTVGNAVGQWLAVGGSVQLGYSNSLTGTHGSSGYQKFPNGLIIQWGQGSTSSSGTISQTLPIAFPNGWAGGFACVNQVGPYFGVVNVLGSTTIEITGYISSSGAAIGVGCEFTWFAIGY